MTALSEWLGAHLLGAGYGDTSWATLLGELRDRHGSGRAVARHLGVNESVVRRALSGKTRQPKPSTVEAIRRAALVDPAARGAGAISLHTVQREDGRHRTLTDANLKMRPEAMDRVAETWVKTGDLEAASRTFLDGIGEPFYRAYLVPKEGALRPVETGATVPGGGGGEGEGGDYYYDDAGQAYEVDPEDADLDYYDDLYDYADEVYAGDPDSYGGDIA